MLRCFNSDILEHLMFQLMFDWNDFAPNHPGRILNMLNMLNCQLFVFELCCNVYLRHELYCKRIYIVTSCNLLLNSFSADFCVLSEGPICVAWANNLFAIPFHAVYSFWKDLVCTSSWAKISHPGSLWVIFDQSGVNDSSAYIALFVAKILPNRPVHSKGLRTRLYARTRVRFFFKFCIPGPIWT